MLANLLVLAGSVKWLHLTAMTEDLITNQAVGLLRAMLALNFLCVTGTDPPLLGFRGLACFGRGLEVLD